MVKFNGKLTLTVHQGRNLKICQMLGKMSPYCKIEYRKEHFKTGVAKHQHQTPTWETAMIFNIREGEPTDILRISGFNQETLTDDCMGIVSYELQNIIKALPDGKQWYMLKDKDNYALEAGEIQISGSWHGDDGVVIQPGQPTASPVAAAPAQVSPVPSPSPPAQVPAAYQQPGQAPGQPAYQQPPYGQQPQQPYPPQQQHPPQQQYPPQQYPPQPQPYPQQLYPQQQPVYQQPGAPYGQAPVYQQQAPVYQQPVYQQPQGYGQPTYQPAPVFQPASVFQPAVQVVMQPAPVVQVISPTSVQFSSRIGPTHGDTIPFNDRDYLGANFNYAQIVEVRVWASEYVHGIQVVWNANGSLIEGPRHVHSHHHHLRHQSLYLDVSGGEYITGIEGSWGSWTDNITIITTRQRVRFGASNGGTPQIIQLPFGSKVLGFHGGYGQHLHNFGVIFASAAQNLPTAGVYAAPSIPLF